MSNQLTLLKERNFLPLFITQFLGALNDNIVKAIMSVMIAYGLWDIGEWSPGVLIAIATGLFILPFALLTPIAGNLSDKYDKAKIIRITKRAEIIIAFAAIIALYTNNLPFSLIVLFALGVQSAFFTPCKFAILPQHLKTKELITGNAWISTGTYFAILTGTIIGAALAPIESGKLIASGIILAAAFIGYAAAIKIPNAPPPMPNLKISANIFAQIIPNFRHAIAQKSGVFVAMFGVAYFYFVAATFHAQFPNFTKHTLGADNFVLIAFMITFSCGIAAGGFLSHKISKGKIHGAIAPIACFCMGVFGTDIYFAAHAYPTPTNETLHTLAQFTSNIHGIRLLTDTFLQSLACGLFIIPLRAIVQDRTQPKVRARVISSSNMMEALFILLSAILSGAILSAGFAIEDLYLFVSITTILVAMVLFFTPSLKETA